MSAAVYRPIAPHPSTGKELPAVSSSFDLLTQPWLPCLPLDSDRPVALSLPDALANAHRYRELVADSPLVAVALHRLLLAVLHRAYMGPRNADQWHALWSARCFDAERVRSYLTDPRWRTHFDLFDARRPFYQVAEIEGTDPSSIAVLSLERASGNSITLFDHTTGDTAALSPAEAARYLTSFQLYAMAGGNSTPFYFSNGPLAGDYSILVQGATLFETLMLNLVRYDDEAYLGRPLADDSAWWERDHDPAPERQGTPPCGYCDYLTWQSRRVRLLYDKASGTIRTCQVRQNLSLSPNLIAPDLFKAYRDDAKRGKSPQRLNAEKAVWRDSHALLEEARNAGSRPEIFEWLATLFPALRPGIARAFDFEVIGYLTELRRATVILWRCDRLPLPLSYLAPEGKPLRDELQTGLQAAEDVSRLCRAGYIPVKSQAGTTQQQPSPLRVLAKNLLTLSPDRKPDGKDITDLANHFAVERTYWASLEPRFEPFMLALADDPPPGQTRTDHFDAVVIKWKEEIRAVARRTFDGLVTSLESDVRSLRAAALAQRQFNWLLNVVLPVPERESEPVGMREQELHA